LFVVYIYLSAITAVSLITSICGIKDSPVFAQGKGEWNISLNPRNTEKEEDLKEPLLDKQSTIEILERSRERGTASEQIIIYIPDDLEPDPDYTCCIQKVPEKLRRICPEAYTPQLVSIGPIHYGKPILKAMELCKAKYEEAFWNRDFCKHIQDGTEFMKTNGWLAKFQRSYAVTIHSVDSLHFQRMILRDACFILELFLRNCEIRLHNINIPSDARFKLHQDIKDHQKDSILRRPWLKAAIKQDLILLENQLPYFVFTDLLNSILKNKPANTFLPSLIADQESEGREDLDASIKKIACEFFIDYYKFGKPPAAGAVAATIADADVAAKGTFLDIHPRNVDMKDKSKEIISCDNFRSIKHFTDLVRRFMRPVALNNENFKGNGVHCLYSVKRLDSAGVNFVRSENENATLTDIKPKDEGCCWWNGRCCC
ncbi:uncharacterized protein LOC107434276, partial [Ziziphus jujuba]|uniref:Uncharacterized protein LOC107434276 n=1 Tax=Ziziphus jujuba TaxID=326968 RepID=A0A6P4BEE4_ZIZJJ